ncbi:hypothetical protein J6590_017522 [Homalodisca vitripennis]|nr:hypothetical protein J6590_017522 [Homalodisca vitripennis]
MVIVVPSTSQCHDKPHLGDTERLFRLVTRGLGLHSLVEPSTTQFTTSRIWVTLIGSFD